MATLLYRLGRLAARRAWLVIVAWVVILGLAVGAFLAFGGSLVSAVSVPGTATEKVSDQLNERLPDASGGTGRIVFQTTDGSAFTDRQKADIDDVLTSTTDLDAVNGVVNPFEVEARLAQQRQQAEDGRTKLDDGRNQLDDGQSQLDAAQEQLDEGQKQLDAAQAQAEAAGPAALAQVQPQLDAQQSELDAGQKQLDAQQDTLDSSTAELTSQAAKLDDGQTLLELSSGIRQVSKDSSTAIGTVRFDVSTFDLTPEQKQSVIDEVRDQSIDGVDVEFSQEFTESVPEILGPGEVAGLIVAAITLLVMLGTLIGAGLPLLNALLGVGVGVLASLALSGSIEMLAITPVLGVMLGLAVGIDYSLFILNRHRTQLRDGVELHDSIGLANGTSGNAVVFAGTTVLIALLALNITGIPFLGLMGTVGAVCVFVAILVAITLTPAMLRLIGPRILSKKQRARIGKTGADVAASDAATVGSTKGRSAKANPPKAVSAKPPREVRPMGTLRAALTLAAGLIVLLVVAAPALSMRLGLPAASSEPVESTQYKAYKIIDDKFGQGVNGALLVVADLPTAVSDDDMIAEQARIGTELGGFDDVSAVAPIGASDDGTLIAFQLVPDDGPSSATTEQLVTDLRAASPIADGVTLGVAGNASANIDVSEKLAAVLPLYLAVVVGLSLIILVFVFRSILVPITATLGFVLSVFAAFGGITAIFQWGWFGEALGVHDPGPILSFLPILVIGILFGLAMDYQLFLVSGMREAYAHGDPARLAVQRGLRAGRTVVTAAAIIMISVFAGFIFSNSVMIQSIGFALSFGVLVDAFVVRMLLIPAVMHLLGPAAWWIPKWLDRILPNVDVEGASLERGRPVPAQE